MPEGEQTEPATEDDAADAQDAEASGAEPEAADGVILSPYGIASAVLGVLSVAAIVLVAIIWSTHRDESAERTYLSRVMQTAADWTGVLINMNSTNVDASLQRLHDGTVGELNTDFDATVQPYRQVVRETAVTKQRPDRGGGDRDGAPRPGYPTRCRAAGGHHQAAAVRHPDGFGDAGRDIGQRERRRQTADGALEPAPRCLQRRWQADDLSGWSRSDEKPVAGCWRSTSWRRWPQSARC